jgi:hypothetical protein
VRSGQTPIRGQGKPQPGRQLRGGASYLFARARLAVRSALAAARTRVAEPDVGIALIESERLGAAGVGARAVQGRRGARLRAAEKRLRGMMRRYGENGEERA